MLQQKNEKVTENDLIGHINTLDNKFNDYLPLIGGNLTGRLTLIGIAQDIPLMTRGIFGSDGEGNPGDLYLNYDATGTNQFSIHLGYNGAGVISADGLSYNGNSATATMPLGFNSRTTGATWGNTTGTSFTSWNDASGGSIDFRKDNPSSGKMSVKVDGRFYFNEGNTPCGGLKSANGYWGMTGADGEDNCWIRTTSQGIIPYQGGGAGAGHGYLGTSSWYFGNIYVDNIYTASRSSSWLEGLKNEGRCIAMSSASNTGGYWPWIRQTNTSNSRWFSMGTLGTSFYFIGSATSRTANGYDFGMQYNTANGYLYANSHQTISSRKYKKDILDYKESALDKINQINIVSFKFNSDDDNTDRHIGFIAEDTPEELAGSEHNRMDLNNCVGMLLKAVQELSDKVNRLEGKLN